MRLFSEPAHRPDALAQPVVQRLITHLQAGQTAFACACASEIVDTGASYWLRDVRRTLEPEMAKALDEVIRMTCDSPVDIIRGPEGSLACLFPMALMFRLQFARPVSLNRACLPFEMTHTIRSAPRAVLNLRGASTVFTEPRLYTKWAAHDTSLKTWRQHMRMLGSAPPSQSPLALRNEDPSRHEMSPIHYVGMFIYISAPAATRNANHAFREVEAKDADALARVIGDEIKQQRRFARVEITPGGALVPASQIANAAHTSELKARLAHTFSEAMLLKELGGTPFHAVIKVDQFARRFQISLHPPHDREPVATYERDFHSMDETEPTNEIFLGALRDCGVTNVEFVTT